MMVGAQNREHGLKREEGAKSESQRKRLCEKKAGGKHYERLQDKGKIWRECEINRDGKSLREAWRRACFTADLLS